MSLATLSFMTAPRGLVVGDDPDSRMLMEHVLSSVPRKKDGPAARGGRRPAQAGHRSLRGYFNENVRPVENRWTRGVDSSR
jgi:hypothetical protein